jgi:hypothetical protein
MQRYSRLHYFRVRLISINQTIKFCFILACISILLIELVLKNYPSINDTLYKTGDIYLKICYSIAAATIFYFINQHLPREDRKSKAYLFINNRLASIDHELQDMLHALKVETGSNTRKVTLDAIFDACKKINPMDPHYGHYETSVPFNNWYEYFTYKTIKIKNNIHDLLLINEALDVDLMGRLLILDDLVYSTLYFDKKRWGNKDLSTWGTRIYEIIKQNDKAYEILLKKYKKYEKESSARFHKDYREFFPPKETNPANNKT